MKKLRTMPALLLAAATFAASGATDEDALDLQAASAAPAAAQPGKLRLALELAAVHGNKQAGLGSEDGHRAAMDVRWYDALADGWRFGLSDRLDDLHPALPGQRGTRNQLREAYLSWQGSGQAVELGRVNLRHGPSYGFNPTDVFREGATRTVVTADPVALRENRTGTFMVRGSRLWDGGSASVTWAPQLTTQALSDMPWTLDLAATNSRHRLLFTTNAKASDRLSGEALAMLEQGHRPTLGANATGLVGDATVLHGEWSMRSTPSLLDAALGRPERPKYRQKVSAGATYALPGGLTVTAEAAYNGAGLNRDAWQTLFAQGLPAASRLLATAQASQEQASRRAWLLYATKKDALVKQLDFTAFFRQDLDDHSTLAWAEFRYHWNRSDLAVQFQRSSSHAGTEFGAMPYRQLIQLVGYAYF